MAFLASFLLFAVTFFGVNITKIPAWRPPWRWKNLLLVSFAALSAPLENRSPNSSTALLVLAPLA